MYLNGLKTAKDLVLPEKINGSLFLNGLKTAEGLVLPKENGSLSLDGLETSNDLALPKKINGVLFLNGLKTSEGLVLPNDFNLNLLLCNNNIKLEIKNNPEIYFRESLDTKENKKVR